mgnify:FL=1
MSKSKKQFKRFLVAGSCAVATDLTTYYITINFLNYDISKTISFILGTVVAFIINKYWTFEKYEKSFKQIFHFSILYISTLFANIYTNRLILEITEFVFFAFIFATTVSTVLNFIGQKWWVFR